MKTMWVLLAASLAVITACPAFAQDSDDEEAPVTPVRAFSGLRVEATVGYNHLDITSLKDIDPAADVGATRTGVTFGAAVGYDFPLSGRLIGGVEFGIYASSIRWPNTENLVVGTFNTSQVNEGRDFFFGPRLGYALNKKTMVFAKGGYTNTLFGVTGTDGPYVPYSGTGSNLLYQGVSASGLRVGGGIEQKVTHALYVKLEYDYSHYASGQFNYVDTTPDGSTFDLHANQQQVLASVGLRF